ncbi:1049_t:CDS:2, partial [Cetraspora pellucida]
MERQQEKGFQNIPAITSSIDIQYLNNNNVQFYDGLETFNSYLLINPSSVVSNLLESELGSNSYIENELELDCWDKTMDEQEPSFAISNDLEESSYDKSSNSELNRSSNDGSISIEIAQKLAAYFSVIDSLQMQYKDPLRMKLLRYRNEYTSREEYLSENSKI